MSLFSTKNKSIAAGTAKLVFGIAAARTISQVVNTSIANGVVGPLGVPATIAAACFAVAISTIIAVEGAQEVIYPKED